MKKATHRRLHRCHLLIHPNPGYMGEGGIWPPSLELMTCDVPEADARALLAPEYVVFRAFATRAQAQYELGVMLGN